MAEELIHQPRRSVRVRLAQWLSRVQERLEDETRISPWDIWFDWLDARAARKKAEYEARTGQEYFPPIIWR